MRVQMVEQSNNAYSEVDGMQTLLNYRYIAKLSRFNIAQIVSRIHIYLLLLQGAKCWLLQDNPAS